MGKKAKGGGLKAGGKGELKAMEALGIDVGRGDLDVDGGRSCAAASPAMGRENLEEVTAVLFMEEVMAGGGVDLGKILEGMGIDPLVHKVLGGGEEVWPKIQAADGGAGAGKLPEVAKSGGRLLRSGRTWGVPTVGAGCMDVTVNSSMQGVGEGYSFPVPAMAGGMAGGAGVVAGGASLLGVALAAGVLGRWPARGGMAGMCNNKVEGYWEEVAGGCEVSSSDLCSGDLCSGNVWKVNGKLMATRRWVAGGGEGRKLRGGEEVAKKVLDVVGGEEVAGGCGWLPVRWRPAGWRPEFLGWPAWKWWPAGRGRPAVVLMRWVKVEVYWVCVEVRWSPAREWWPELRW